MKQRRITAALLCAILLLSQCNFKIQAASPVTQRQVEAQLAALTEQYEGVAYTDNFNGATQCKGFADMIYDALFHVGTIGIYPAGVYYYMESVSASTKEVGRVKPGYAALDASAVQPLLAASAGTHRRAAHSTAARIFLENFIDQRPFCP